MKNPYVVIIHREGTYYDELFQIVLFPTKKEAYDYARKNNKNHFYAEVKSIDDIDKQGYVN